MKKIPLNKGYAALVSDEDFPMLSQFHWFARERQSKKGITTVRSVETRMRVAKDTQIGIAMHRIIMNPPPGMVVDHIDGNTLNNQRSNLRVVTPGENVRNRKAQPYGIHRYRGVFWDHEENCWKVGLFWDTMTLVGNFETPEEAARFYNAKAIEKYGMDAILNFIK